MSEQNIGSISREQMQELLTNVLNQLPGDKKFAVSLQVVELENGACHSSIDFSASIERNSPEHAQGLFAVAHLHHSTANRLMQLFQPPAEAVAQEDAEAGAAKDCDGKCENCDGNSCDAHDKNVVEFKAQEPTPSPSV